MKFKCSILLSLIFLSFVGSVNGQDGNNTSYFLSNFPHTGLIRLISQNTRFSSVYRDLAVSL